MINLRNVFNKNKKIIQSIFGLLIPIFIAIIAFPQINEIIFRNKNPISFNFDKNISQLNILNKQGEILWTKKLNEKIRTIDESRIKISDLDNNGRNEVIIGYHTYDDTIKFASLSCYDFEGKLKWITPFSKKVKNPNEINENSLSYYYSSYYSINNLICDDLNNDDDIEIIVSYKHIKYWPSFLTVIDNKGNFLYQVLNGGHLSSIGIHDINNDNINDIFAGGVYNNFSDDKSAVILYLNGKRIFNNNGLWKNKICWAPVQDNMQTVDGYFFPQKSIISLLLYGNKWEESILDKFKFFDKFLEINTTCGIHNYQKKINPLTLYLYYDFNRFKYIISTEMEYIKQNPLVTEERLNKYYKERYIYPHRLYYYNFEKMCIDTLFIPLSNKI